MYLRDIWNFAISRESTKLITKKLVKGNDVCRICYLQFTEELIISFDPSNDLEDWISNLRFTGPGVHSGFSTSAAYFSDTVERYVNSFPLAKVYLTGYSRGAALATIMASYVALACGKPCYCVAFGSPIVYSKNLTEFYKGLPIKHLVVRNGWDIVTYLPMKELGYNHVGSLLHLKQPFYHRLMKYRIKDHYAEAYFRAINSLGALNLETLLH